MCCVFRSFVSTRSVACPSRQFRHGRRPRGLPLVPFSVFEVQSEEQQNREGEEGVERVNDRGKCHRDWWDTETPL